jgi:hypothetical protein
MSPKGSHDYRRIQDVIGSFMLQPSQEPLICPRLIFSVSSGFGFDLKTHQRAPGIARVLKFWLKKIGSGVDVNIALLKLIGEHLCSEIQRSDFFGKDLFTNQLQIQMESLEQLARGAAYCSHCQGRNALIFCEACADLFCVGCFGGLHSRGRRSSHRFKAVSRCSCFDECGARASLRLPDSGVLFCISCFKSKYMRTVALGHRETPERIDDVSSLKEDFQRTLAHGESSNMSYHWCPFYDKDGVLFYHNFATGESMRRSPLEMFQDEEDVAEELSDVGKKLENHTGITFESPFDP